MQYIFIWGGGKMQYVFIWRAKCSMYSYGGQNAVHIHMEGKMQYVFIWRAKCSMYSYGGQNAVCIHMGGAKCSLYSSMYSFGVKIQYDI